MYKLYFVNFFYYSEDEFTVLDDALNQAIRIGFEIRIDQNDTPIARVSPIRGIQYY